MQGAVAHLEHYREHLVAEQVRRLLAGWPRLSWHLLSGHGRMILCLASVFD
jgi:hypothetical protein